MSDFALAHTLALPGRGPKVTEPMDHRSELPKAVSRNSPFRELYSARKLSARFPSAPYRVTWTSLGSRVLGLELFLEERESG